MIGRTLMGSVVGKSLHRCGSSFMIILSSCVIPYLAFKPTLAEEVSDNRIREIRMVSIGKHCNTTEHES